MSTWDAIVVGAGPAGALCALELVRRDLRVLLVDKQTFPRAKVCGSCLHPRALDELAAAGLGDLPARLGAPALERWQVAAHGRRFGALLPRAGAVLSREALDGALVAAARAAGVVVRLGAAARLLPASACGDERAVEVGGETTTARLVIAADGLGGDFLRRAGELELPPAPRARVGLGTRLEGADGPRSGTVLLVVARGGYAGVVRLEDGALDVAAALDPAAIAREGRDRAVAAIFEAARVAPPAGLAEARWRGTPPLARRIGPASGWRVFAVGDAAGYVEPFSGEGLSWAFAGARALAPVAAALARRSLSPEDAARAWDRTRSACLDGRQRASRGLATLVRSPRAVATLAHLAGHFPALAQHAIAAAWDAPAHALAGGAA